MMVTQNANKITLDEVNGICDELGVTGPVALLAHAAPEELTKVYNAVAARIADASA